MSVIVEPDRVIIRGEFALKVIYDVIITPGEYPETSEFFEQFDVHTTDYPYNIDFYQGVHLIRVITRRSDGRQFGFRYWQPGNESWDQEVEPNGEEHGIEYQFNEDYEVIGGEAYVFLPVEPSTIDTYRLVGDQVG